MKRTLLCLLLALCIILPLSLQADAATVAYGSLRNGAIQWTLDDAGTMTLTGTGPVPDSTYNGAAPWDAYRD